MLTPETLNRLDAAARKQSDLEFGTTIAVMPGELLELVRGYRLASEQALNPLFLVDMTNNRIELIERVVAASDPKSLVAALEQS